MISVQNILRRSPAGRFTSKQCLRRMASNNDEPKLTKSDEVKFHSVRHCAVEKTPVTAQLWAQRSRGRQSVDQPPNSYVSRVPLEPHDGVPAFLMDKTSKESRLTIKYKFSNDASLRDLYVDALGNVLTGKLFEDLDALAGNIAFSHCDDNNPLSRPLTLVTARVDRIRQSKKISASDDLILTGQVVWVGSSSLDVLMEIHREKDIKVVAKVEKDSSTSVEEEMIESDAILIEENVSSRLLSSLFTYVARDTRTGKACPVNRFIPNGKAEEELYARRSYLAAMRKSKKTENTGKNVLSGISSGSGFGFHSGSDTQSVLMSLVERGSAMVDMPALASSNAVLMKYTVLENSLVCQPQNVNMAGRVFGGYLMHRAYDLALATGYIFAGAYPHFLEVDQIDFKKPVDIGDLVRLKSRVVFTNDDPVMSVLQVEVTCQVVRPERASSFVSNTFNFVFRFEDTVSLRRVLPSTTEEAVILVKAASWVNSTDHNE